jgi:hypothetical protein
MTKLEEEFAKAFVNKGGSAKEMREINAKVAAEVAKKYIERAWYCSYGFAVANRLESPSLSQWCKENGITSDNSVQTIDPPY